MKMTCKEAQKFSKAYVDRTISDRNLTNLIAHVRSCGKCYDELEQALIIHNALDILSSDNIEDINIDKILERDLERNEAMLHRHKVIFGLVKTLVIVFLVLIALIALCMIFPEKFGLPGQWISHFVKTLVEGRF